MEHVASVSVNEVFVFMGRELEALDEIPAGNILGTVCVFVASHVSRDCTSHIPHTLQWAGRCPPKLPLALDDLVPCLICGSLLSPKCTPQWHLDL